MMDRKGFTLIELLVCIAIVAALAVVATVGTRGTLASAKNKESASLINEVSDAVITYSHLSSYDGTTITLHDLVNAGLLDESYYSKDNPLFSDKVKLTEGFYKIEKNGEGVYEVIYTNTGTNYCNVNLSLVSNNDWGTC